MAKRKRSKRASIRNADFFGGPLYGLDFAVPEEDEDVRTAGPDEPESVRTDGDDPLAAMLARALEYSGREERLTHGFHTYPAGMHPDAAAEIIQGCPGESVHDPFCGGGTVLVEGMMAKRRSSGTDISPIAILVAAARTASADMATPLRAAARRITDAAKERADLPVPEEVVSWYEPHVAQEIARLRAGILQEDPSVQPLLNAVLSSILIKASFRESDTSNNRVPEHRPPGTTLTLFHKKARLLGRSLELIPADVPRPVVLHGDASATPPPAPVDLVLTSPPYPGVYDYLPMQQLRYAWLDCKPGKEFTQEIGSRRDFRSKGRAEALTDWQKATHRWIGFQAQHLNPGGRMVIMVGDGLVGDRMVDALYPTVEAMEAAGLQIIARASADRPDYARDSERIEHLVMAEKPR